MQVLLCKIIALVDIEENIYNDLGNKNKKALYKYIAKKYKSTKIWFIIWRTTIGNKNKYAFYICQYITKAWNNYTILRFKVEPNGSNYT